MYSISQELLEEYGVDYSVLDSIIEQTADNSYSGNSFKKQTGPAIRGDRATINKHLVLLSSHPDFKFVYESITQEIIKRKKKHVEL